MLAVIRPASAGVTALNTIAAPGAGKKIRIHGYSLMADAAGAVFLSSAAVQVTASLLDVAYLGLGVGTVQTRYEAGAVDLPANTGLWVLPAGAANIYGHIDYSIMAAA